VEREQCDRSVSVDRKETISEKIKKLPLKVSKTWVCNPEDVIIKILKKLFRR
jgi:hypothetical protein